jgi:hypothetical protein
MSRFFIKLIIIISLMLQAVPPAQALAQQLSSSAISAIQQQFNGRIVGVNPTGDGNMQVQVLMSNGQMVIVIVNANGAIQGVSR